MKEPEEMEKYGVNVNQPVGRVKTASEKITCPICGTEVEQHGSVLKCPKHGTRPFERLADEENKG